MRYCFLLPILLISATLLSAQNRQETDKRKLEMQQERIAFFTRELALSKEESIALGKILRELDEKKIALRSEVHTLAQELREKEKPSQEELTTYIKLRCENKIKIAKVEEEKLLELSKVLPPEKVLHIDQAKRKFFDQFARKLSR